MSAYIFIENMIFFGDLGFQITIRRIICLPLSGETMNPSICPCLGRCSWSVPGSPCSESPIVDGLHGFQRNFSSLRNFREGFSSRIHLPKLLGVGGSLGFLSRICSEFCIVFFEHFSVSHFNFSECFETSEIFKWSVNFSLSPS